MKKSILTTVLSLSLLQGCSNSNETATNQPATDIVVSQEKTSETRPDLSGMGATAGETRSSSGMGAASSSTRSGSGSPQPKKTFFSNDSSSDVEGIVQSSQITQEALDYTNMKESTNFSMAPRSASRPSSVTVNGYNNSTATTTSSSQEPKFVSQEFKMAMQEPLSTFSADVDTASYANVRQQLAMGVVPSPSLVRVEEMLNYFNYQLPQPKAGQPFSVTTEVSDCPWNDKSRLLRVAIKTKDLDRGKAPARNLVFLVDVSGSMNAYNKLPLLKQSLRKLVDTLDDNDRVAVVVYASASGVVLDSTTGDRKTKILAALENLRTAGGTNGVSGIELAYQVAAENSSDGSVDRVILATDGDFNVGISNKDELKSFIEKKRESGLSLSVLGFGHNSNDKVMEALADNGNGNYSVIDTLNEAEKVLVEQSGATLVTVAKDVKFQIAFDPAQVKSYRMIGYKNRQLAARDFDDDEKDAGELGAGHSVTALYEFYPTAKAESKSMAKIKLRYKKPGADESQLMEVAANGTVQTLGAESSADQQWAAAVAMYGQLLSRELAQEEESYNQVAQLAKASLSKQPDSYKAEFYELIGKTDVLSLQSQ